MLLKMLTNIDGPLAPNTIYYPVIMEPNITKLGTTNKTHQSESISTTLL